MRTDDLEEDRKDLIRRKIVLIVPMLVVIENKGARIAVIEMRDHLLAKTSRLIRIAFPARCVACRATERRCGFQRENALGIDLGNGAVELQKRDDVPPRRDTVHIDALGVAEDQTAFVSLRKQVVRNADDQRMQLRDPRRVPRNVEVVKYCDQVQGRVVIDIEVIGRAKAADAANVLDDLSRIFHIAIEKFDCIRLKPGRK